MRIKEHLKWKMLLPLFHQSLQIDLKECTIFFHKSSTYHLFGTVMTEDNISFDMNYLLVHNKSVFQYHKNDIHSQ